MRRLSLFSTILLTGSITSSKVSEYNNCKSKPIRTKDQVEEVAFKEFETSTNYRVSITEQTVEEESFASFKSKHTQHRFTIEVTDEKIAFEGFFVHVTSKIKSIPVGRLALTSDKSFASKYIRQLKCNKPSDAIRSKSLSRFNTSPKILQQLSFDWSGTCSNSIEFQIFLAPKITKKTSGKKSKSGKKIKSGESSVVFEEKPENQGDVWYFTRLSCESIKELLKTSSDQPTVQLKAASLNFNSDDVQLKNAYRKIVKVDKEADRRSSTSGGNQLTVMNLNDGNRFSEKNEKSEKMLKNVDKTVQKKVIERSKYRQPSWNQWASWGDCNKSCGQGEMQRKRLCESFDGRVLSNQFCEGSSVHTTSCLLSKCPQWSTWYPWSICTATCGDGSKTRRRVCLNSSDDHTCEGSKNETVECNVKSCKGGSKLQTTNSGVLPFEGDCEDKYSFCGHWQKKGYCEHRFTKWMSMNCPVACSKCTQVKEECYDVVEKF